MEKFLTPEGFKKLKKELQHLKEVKRKDMAQRLKKSISYGDLSENSEYQEAKEAQGFLEGKIVELEELMTSAEIISPKKNSGVAQIGSTILVSSGLRKEKFRIVGAEEANPVEGKISADSPLGKAVLNQSSGAKVEIKTPDGKVLYKIIKVE
ncbi:MAG TPA: transcription elongation factor GreA [Candidatus Parcubacteria bacterium]|jgi:transcription elongation factor GreA|nr:transcription elongation factor GreA [Parcubacteria group bacterium]HJN62163.1 transcription elongation factor GreA [Candidatus Parcubacteria bacterium]|tara:strand:- start:202 stop:657 length:456 start_codon:yes stop_codon:yes gene_type:complete